VHRLDEFLGATVFTLASPTLLELCMAFKQLNGRQVCIESGNSP
jgi:hypothetical protein